MNTFKDSNDFIYVWSNSMSTTFFTICQSDKL